MKPPLGIRERVGLCTMWGATYSKLARPYLSLTQWGKRVLSILLLKQDKTRTVLIMIIVPSISNHMSTASFEAGLDFDSLFKMLCFRLWITEVISTAFMLTLSSVLPSSLVVKACQLRVHYTRVCLLTWFNGCCCREWSLWIEICLTAVEVLKQKCFFSKVNTWQH